jgi:hypothetical protein
MWGGFLAAAFSTMRQSDRIAWAPYFGLALIGVVGVVLLRRTAGAAAKQSHVVSSNLGTLEASLRTALERVRALLAARERVFVYDVHGRIDAELAAPLGDFAEAREAMIHGLSLSQYAEVMDHFARGERFVNRAWSASADGYVDEMWNSMQIAERELSVADETLRGYLSRRGQGAGSS